MKTRRSIENSVRFGTRRFFLFLCLFCGGPDDSTCGEVPGSRIKIVDVAPHFLVNQKYVILHHSLSR